MRALVLAIALAAATTAHADDDAGVGALIDRAYAERDALRYREAIVAINEALGLGRASASQMRALFRLGGELHAGLDEPDVAQEWFARWLALVPDGHLLPDTSPKITAPLEAARAQLGGRAIALHVALLGEASVAIAIDGDPLDMVRGVRIRSDGGGAPWVGPIVAPGEALYVPEQGGSAAVVVDAHGNELVEVPFGMERGLHVGRPTPWKPIAITAAVFAITGGVFAWRTAVAQDEFDRLRADSDAHTFAELEAVEARGHRNQLITLVAFSATAVTALAATYFYLKAPRGGARPPRLLIGATVAPDRAGVALSGRF